MTNNGPVQLIKTHAWSAAQLTETSATSTVHDGTKIPRRPNWRRPRPKWQNNDLDDPIIEEWRTTPLHYADRTDCDRPHLPTIPNLTTEVRPRCSRRNQGREGGRRERGREGERGRRWAYCLNELPCI
ncbi:hypothetical protein GW17_00042919 [Ensete ventricosum]|nr:hypothetical protein GW17_00042919 [Ensete ventricosum]RZR83103.1 hypothetical protein BHM03_00009656 [Ensete ventricosum]